MRYDTSSYLIFFGAGASASFGIPTMRVMTDEFARALDKDGEMSERQLYREIIDHLTKDLGQGAVDVEAIMSVLKALKDYRPENLGELALFASHKIFRGSLLNSALSPTPERLKTINSLEQLSAIHRSALPNR